MTDTVRRATVQVEHLTKRRGEARILDDVSFSLGEGRIVGFLGPNGAGKSTTLRLIMGLDEPTEGRVLIDGQPIREWPSPGRKIAAVLSNRCAHPRRTALHHLRWVGHLLDVDAAGCRDVLEAVGLAEVADVKAGKFSLGMTQRLALGTALLGEPRILLLDEPMNGLDPQGMDWLRTTLRRLRDEGRTILLTSHLLKEMEDLVDDLIILAHGAVVAAGTTDEIVARFRQHWVAVRVDDPARLAAALRAIEGVQVVEEPSGRLRVSGADADQIGATARDLSLSVLELTVVRDLNSAYHEATDGRFVIRGKVR